jgi:hypothetical protein
MAKSPPPPVKFTGAYLSKPPPPPAKFTGAYTEDQTPGVILTEAVRLILQVQRMIRSSKRTKPRKRRGKRK